VYCAVKLIYEAAKKTPKVTTSSGKEVAYEFSEGGLSGTCWLCGCETGAGFSKKQIIKPTFTDHDIAKAPGSKVVCEHCAWALSRRELRNYSILATSKGFFHPSRPQIREVLLNPPEPPFVLCVAKSGQKWLHIKSEQAVSREGFPVFFEGAEFKRDKKVGKNISVMANVYVNPATMRKILSVMETLYANGFNRWEIATGEYFLSRVLDFGLERKEELDEIIAPYRGQALFYLALFAADKEKGEIYKKWEWSAIGISSSTSGTETGNKEPKQQRLSLCM
jgi:hypothetical protein